MKPRDYYDLVSSKVTLDDVMQKNHLLYLESIPQTQVAVYQTVSLDVAVMPGEEAPSLKVEPMKREVDEVIKLEAKTDIVVGPDGKALKMTEFRHNVSSDEFDIDSLEELLLLCHYEQEETSTPHQCAICDARFETEKTLILHIQLKHISSTKVYQCPSCSQTFLQAALVIKHLSNDHKKSMKKIRSMRESIHKRHMRIDEVQVKGPSRELNRLQTEKERIDAENKAYLDNMANFDNTNQSMCTYCNKIFERKAVLTSHMVNCRIKFEKMFISSNGGSSNSSSAVSQPSTSGNASGTGSGPAKRGPKPKDNGAKEKELNHDENSSSTVISSDGSNEGGAVNSENGEAPCSKPAASKTRKRKSATSGAVAAAAKGSSSVTTVAPKKPKKDEQTHSNVSELLEKEMICNLSTTVDRDDSYFSYDDKAPEDMRDDSMKRRFPCEICNKSFSTMSNLKRHNGMFHYFQNSYMCRICGCPAMKKAEALVHLRDVHKFDKDDHEIKSHLKMEKNEVRNTFFCSYINMFNWFRLSGFVVRGAGP